MNYKIFFKRDITKFLFYGLIIVGFIINISACSLKKEIEEKEIEEKEIQEENMTTQENQSLTFGVSIADKDDVFISSICKEMEKLINEKESIIFKYAENKFELQEQQLEELISQKVDALIVQIVNGGNAKSFIDKAKTADIPIIFFNREPDAQSMKSYDKAKYVGAAPLEAGIIQGELIVDIWRSKNYDRNKDGIIQYVLLQGEKNNLDTMARTEWTIKAIEENGIKIQLLSTAVCDWDREKGKRAMKHMFNQYGNQIDFVFSNNDNMAIGAIEVLQEKGYNKGNSNKMIPIVGVDGLQEAKQYVKDKKMSGTVVQDGVGMAKASLAMARNAARGEDFLYKTEYVYDETQYAVRVNYFKYDPIQE